MMKITAVVFTAVGVGLSLSAGSALTRNPAAQQAPTADEHKAWMDDAGVAQEDLRDALQAKEGAKVAAAAVTIESLMAKTEAYWAGKNASDIVTLARESRALATQVAAAAQAGQLDQSDAAFTKMNANCSACHDLHPEKR